MSTPMPARATHPEDIAIAERYAGAPCHLDGRPARVTGRMLRFALIAVLEPLDGGTTYNVEYSWPAVEHIMEDRAGWFGQGTGGNPRIHIT